MSNIKFCALGGLGEIGKNLYTLEIDNDIFVLDCGIKQPSSDLLGVDAVIPNVKYLYDNKERVKGIFVTHGHEEHIGALASLFRFLGVGVFGSHFTISVIEDMLKEEGLNVADYRLYRINEDKVMKFGNTEVDCFRVAHSIPEALNYCFKTKDGNIFYCPDFTFDVNENSKYYTSINKISSLTNNPTLLVLAESIGAKNYNRVNNDTTVDYLLDDILKEDARIIFTAYSEELSRIQKIIDASIKRKRKIAIIGTKAQRIISRGIESGYLQIPTGSLVNLKYIDDVNGKPLPAKKIEKNISIIVTGEKHKPFYSLQRMCRGDDRLIHITSDDHVVIMSPSNASNDRCATKAKDEVFRVGAKYTEIKRDILRSTHADGEDLKLLYSITQPKYIIPIEGEEQRLYAHKEIALDIGFKEGNILMLENGLVATFKDGEYVGAREKVAVGDVLTDGSIFGINSAEMIKTREQMAEDGLIICNIAINQNKLTIESLPDCIIKGVSSEKDNEELKDKIISCIIDEIQLQFNRHKYVDFEYMKDRIQSQISYEVKNLTKKNPKVLLTFVDVNI